MNTPPDNKNTSENTPPLSRSWLTIPLACLALILSLTSLWFSLNKTQTSTPVIATSDLSDFSDYTHSQKKQQTHFTMQLAALFKKPSVSLGLYQLALTQTESPVTKKTIQMHINTLRKMGHHTPAATSALYMRLVKLSYKASALPIPNKTTKPKPENTNETSWGKTKRMLVTFIRIQAVPKHVLYDMTSTEKHILIARLQLQLSLAQWGVINRDDTVYASAIKAAKQLASHDNSTRLPTELNALPSSLKPPKKDGAQHNNKQVGS